MTVYNEIDMNGLRQKRRERGSDQLYRMQLGLSYVGLAYEAFSSAPKEIYRDWEGNRYHKVGPCHYQQISKA